MATLSAIRDSMSRRQPLTVDRSHFAGHKAAAVALVLRDGPAGPEILYLLRASHDADPWSGDIGFPGGHIEDGDATAQVTAIRETREEVGLDLLQAEFLGQLDDIAGAHLPIIISCFVFHFPQAPSFSLNHEVVDVFWVPLQQLTDPSYHISTTVRFRGESLVRPAIDLLGPGRTVLWGITYRLTVQFLGLINHHLPPTPIP